MAQQKLWKDLLELLEQREPSTCSCLIFSGAISLICPTFVHSIMILSDYRADCNSIQLRSGSNNKVDCPL